MIDVAFLFLCIFGTLPARSMSCFGIYEEQLWITWGHDIRGVLLHLSLFLSVGWYCLKRFFFFEFEGLELVGYSRYEEGCIACGPFGIQCFVSVL